MISTITQFEFRRFLSNRKNLLFTLVFTLIFTLIFAGQLGWIDGGWTTRSRIYYDSPAEIFNTLKLSSRIWLFLIPFIVITVLGDDYASKSSNYLFSYPIMRGILLVGKIIAVGSILFLIALLWWLCLLVLTNLPFDNLRLGYTSPGDVYTLFFVYILSNSILVGLFCTASIAVTKKPFSAYLILIILIVVNVILTNGMDEITWVHYLDPLGEMYWGSKIQLMNIEERNTLTLPIDRSFLSNRLLWLSLGIASLLFAKDQFAQLDHAKSVSTKFLDSGILALLKPWAEKVRNWPSSLTLILTTTVIDLKYLWSLRLFRWLLLLSIMIVPIMIINVTQLGDMTLLPASIIAVRIPGFIFSLVLMLLTFFVGGQIIQHPRDMKFSALIDSTPVSRPLIMSSQVLTLCIIQWVALLAMIGAIILIQNSTGYSHHRADLLLFNAFVIIFPGLLIWSIVTVSVHTFFKSLIPGLFILCGIWLSGSILHTMGITEKVFHFNYSQPLEYTDFFFLPIGLKGHMASRMYWALIALALFFMTSWWIERRSRLFFSMAMLTIVVSAILGIWLWQEERATFDHKIKDHNSISRSQSELSAHAHLPVPKIRHIDMQLDIHPSQRAFSSAGSYILENSGEHPIDTIVMVLGFDEITTFDFDRPFRLVSDIPQMKCKVVVLNDALNVGEKMTMQWHVKNESNILLQRNSNVLPNGSMIRSDYFPRFGAHHRLEDKDTAADPNAHYQGGDSDKLTMTYTISTENPQLAIGPGILLDSSQVGDRTEYHYQLEGPEKLNFSFHSGEFEVVKSEGYVDVLIYRLPTHDSNDQNIIEGIRDALKYYEDRLAPFPYSLFKIVEFPLIEGSHATLFGDLMPMSEIRFLDGSAHDINKIDLSYYIPAHETGHLWWGNLCLPAKGKGARVLTESLTEFSTLQIYQNKYGTEAGIDFIEKQRYRYLQGRAHNDNEVPLMDAGKDDDFLTYGKGTLTLHALSLIWSADSLNHALRSFLEAYCHATPPYPTSKIFFDHIHSVLPDSIQEWWHLKLATKEIDDIKIISAQIENDSLVVEIEQANSHMSVAYTDILLEDESGRSLALQRIRVMPGSNTYTIPFTGSVTSVRLDPYHLLIERHRDDNLLIISH